MSTTRDQLLKLLAFHENAAAAVRATLSLLAAQPVDGRSSNGLSTVAKQALALDAQRQAVKHAGPRPRGHKIRDRRQRSADYLKNFDTKEPRLPGEFERFGIGSLVRRGYLQRKGPGYIRTAKPYFVNRRDATAK